jgi:hypothetical protein
MCKNGTPELSGFDGQVLPKWGFIMNWELRKEFPVMRF